LVDIEICGIEALERIGEMPEMAQAEPFDAVPQMTAFIPLRSLASAHHETVTNGKRTLALVKLNTDPADIADTHPGLHP
jgi:hypothetical protein